MLSENTSIESKVYRTRQFHESIFKGKYPDGENNEFSHPIGLERYGHRPLNEIAAGLILPNVE